MGVIAGGHSDGCLTLWDASKIVGGRGDLHSTALLYQHDIHGGRSVNCLEFNPNKPSLLGTGGADGQVQVISIDRPSQPDIFRDVTTTRHANSEVVCLSWNRKVQHILATCSNQGLTVIWDLKNKKEVISFKDPANRTRCSALSWNPDIPTQFLVAYNDDTNPCIQMWDMRNCSYPFKEYQEHSRGVTCASFCDLDSNLIVSSGRDNRSVCWSTHSGQLDAYSDLNLSAPAIKLDWSPCLPGFVAASTASGTVSIHSISQRQTPAASSYAPKWVRMPCGVSFGFGGKVVTFGVNQGTSVKIHVIPDEPAVVGEADRFESYLASDLRPFCSAKADESVDEHEKLTWTLISLLFEGPESRSRIVSAMGIDGAEIQALAEKYLGKSLSINPASAAVTTSQDVAFKDTFGMMGDASNLNPDQLDDLFDQLAKSSEQQQQGGFNSNANSRRGTPRAMAINPDEEMNLTDWSQGPEAIIKQSLLIGDITSAVECCLKCGRFADALFLAASGTPELWKRTREEYTRKQKDPFIRLVGYVLANDLEKFVIHSDLSSWVETLAILITYVRDQTFVKLVEMLGERLEKERFDVRSAVLCYLSCASFGNAVRIWASMSNTQGSPTQALQGLVEKMSCLFTAIRPTQIESVFSHKILQYATLLANSGRIVPAMRCLILAPDSTESRILKDRIYNAAPSQMGQLVRGPPPFPFEVSDIRPINIPTPAPIRQQQTPQHGVHQTSVQHGGHQPPPLQHGGYQPSLPQHGVQQPPGAYQQPPQVGGHHQVPMQHGSVPPQRTGFQPTQQPNPYAPAPQHMPVQSGFSNPMMHQAGPPQAGIPQRSTMQVPQGAHGATAPPAMQVGFGQAPPAAQGLHGVSGHSTPPPVIPARTIAAPSIPVRSQPTPGFAVGPPVQASHQGMYAPSPSNASMSGASHRGPASGAGTPGPPPSSGGMPNYQSGLVRPVTGPPSSGGVSTAPHATANPITAGMPVSWPVPNPVQQGLSPNVAVPPPKAPVGPVGEPVPVQEISNIQRSFNGLLERNAQDGNKKKWEDTSRKLGELYDKLATGQISRESAQKVKDLAGCIDRGDFATAGRLRIELSASDWERNRSWLFAVQLLLPK